MAKKKATATATPPPTKYEMFLTGRTFKVAGDLSVYGYKNSQIYKRPEKQIAFHQFANVIDATEHSVTYTVVSMGTVYQQTLRWEDVAFI